MNDQFIQYQMKIKKLSLSAVMDLQKYSKSLLDTNQTVTETERIDSNWRLIWRQSQKLAEIFCEEDIICKTTKSIFLLTRLVYSLSSSTYFSGTVSIITLQSPTFSQVNENAQLGIESDEHNFNKRLYCLKFKDQARIYFKKEIKRKNNECKFILNKITEILQSYRVQNRLSYWITRLNDDVRKHFQNQDFLQSETYFPDYGKFIFIQQ